MNWPKPLTPAEREDVVLRVLGDQWLDVASVTRAARRFNMNVAAGTTGTILNRLEARGRVERSDGGMYRRRSRGEGRDPWGHKVTISVYLEGERAPGSAVAAAQAAARAFEDAGCVVDFAGAAVEPVETKPHDQVAT